MITVGLLTRIAARIYGPDWQRPLSRGLGPLHPDGAREAIDDRLVRRWASGERPIPAWVGPALIRLLDIRASKHTAAAAACRRDAEDLRAELYPEPELDPDNELAPRLG
ncbi:hypothetical protein BHAOGJBA_0614 [Methylobacterium hispanicum]|uniref:Uncharacterized protein n=1 Tax=Methylobacterium hispanicum TaxID=270350 RepID=A0AAV4ZG65_9HYPH|nr:hypothetical protein BHAOGJBA_0614 [Methylobacterium hispanicum]